MTDIQRWLAEYVENGSEAAFRELVTCYFDLVYSTAVRLVGGDAHQAKDVAQTVFVDLARLAKNFSTEVRLGGWLHRHTCFVAAKTMRGERRRLARERRAVEMNSLMDDQEKHLVQLAPLLDDAINRLGAVDRTAIVLRFYERLDYRGVAEAIGANEAAAQKRVARALEKLHALLKRRGVSLSVAALGTALAAGAVSAAPPGLVATVSAAAYGGAAAKTGTTLTLLKIMAASKLQTTVVALVVVATVVTPLLIQSRAGDRLREQEARWKMQSDRFAQLTADNQRLARLQAAAGYAQPASDRQIAEVLKLRSEVGLLQRRVQDMTLANNAPPPEQDQLTSMKNMYAGRVDRLKQWLAANPTENIPELQAVSQDLWLTAVEQLDSDDFLPRAASNLRDNAEGNILGQLGGALRRFAKANNGQFPSDLSQLTPYLKSPIADAVLQRYEIIPSASLISELRVAGDWAITQKAAANPVLDMRQAVGLTDMQSADERVTNRWTLAR